MASSINFNTVWSARFEPLPTFGFLDRLGRESTWGLRHALPYRQVGSDAAPRDGLGITDPALREQVGEERITLFRRHA